MQDYGWVAFVDESGDPDCDLSKDGPSSLFVVAAVVLRREDVGELTRSLQSVAKSRFSGGEIKSSSYS